RRSANHGGRSGPEAGRPGHRSETATSKHVRPIGGYSASAACVFVHSYTSSTKVPSPRNRSKLSTHPDGFCAVHCTGSDASSDWSSTPLPCSTRSGSAVSPGGSSVAVAVVEYRPSTGAADLTCARDPSLL